MVEKYDVTKGNSDTGMAILKLTEGPYAGTTFSYEKIHFGEEDDNGKVALHFDYIVYEGFGIEKPTPEFEKVVGDILVNLLEEQVERDATSGRTDSI